MPAAHSVASRMVLRLLLRRLGSSGALGEAFRFARFQKGQRRDDVMQAGLRNRWSSQPGKIYPLAFDTDVRLVHPPRVVGRFEKDGVRPMRPARVSPGYEFVWRAEKRSRPSPETVPCRVVLSLQAGGRLLPETDRVECNCQDFSNTL